MTKKLFYVIRVRNIYVLVPTGFVLIVNSYKIEIYRSVSVQGSTLFEAAGIEVGM